MVTEIDEHSNKIIIKRRISYYDNERKKHIKRTEIQLFNCEDNKIIDSKEDPYCKELKQYSNLIEYVNSTNNN